MAASPSTWAHPFWSLRRSRSQAIALKLSSRCSWATTPCRSPPFPWANPHAVQVVDDVEAAPVTTQGPLIEHHSRFPRRVNAGYMQIMDASPSSCACSSAAQARPCPAAPERAPPWSSASGAGCWMRRCTSPRAAACSPSRGRERNPGADDRPGHHRVHGRDQLVKGQKMRAEDVATIFCRTTRSSSRTTPRCCRRSTCAPARRPHHLALRAATAHAARTREGAGKRSCTSCWCSPRRTTRCNSRCTSFNCTLFGAQDRAKLPDLVVRNLAREILRRPAYRPDLWQDEQPSAEVLAFADQHPLPVAAHTRCTILCPGSARPPSICVLSPIFPCAPTARP